MRTIGELLERNARFYPGKEALVFEDKRYTYRQLVERTKRVADGLHRLGLRRQDRVAILAMNCAEYVELLCAGDWAGYIVATVNFRLAVPEIEWMLRDSTPRILVFEAQYAETVAAMRARLPGIEAYVCIGAEAPDWAERFDAVAESAPAALRWTKHTLNHWLRQAAPIFDASLALEFIGFAGPEGKEGIDAFLQKRAPSFSPDTPV